MKLTQKIPAWLLPCVAIWTSGKISKVEGWSPSKHELVGRRGVVSDFITAAVTVPLLSAPVFAPSVAHAVDKPAEFTNVGTQAPPPEGTNPFITLDNGVKYKDIQLGKGDSAVSKNSRVDIQCSGKLLNLNGVSFYNTKNNNPDGFGAIPLSIDLGKGQALPGLEAGLIGLRKGGIRRIIVPQDLAYNTYPELQPQPTTKIEQNALDSVVKNPRRDATILFDVKLERVK